MLRVVSQPRPSSRSKTRQKRGQSARESLYGKSRLTIHLLASYGVNPGHNCGAKP